MDLMVLKKKNRKLVGYGGVLEELGEEMSSKYLSYEVLKVLIKYIV